MVWRCDIGERQNGNTNAPENLRNQLQNQVLSETPDLRLLQIHRIGPAFWSRFEHLKKGGVGWSATTFETSQLGCEILKYRSLFLMRGSSRRTVILVLDSARSYMTSSDKSRLVCFLTDLL